MSNILISGIIFVNYMRNIFHTHPYRLPIMRFLITTLLAGLLSALLPAQTARLQVIHNSPDPTVDVYVNNLLVLNDIAFRNASPFVDVPAGLPLQIGIAPSTSTSPADIIFKETVTLESGKTYIAAASGTVYNPATPFQLRIDENAREAATDPGKTDIKILHGALNTPTVDIDTWLQHDLLVDSLIYGRYSDYISLAPGVYDLSVRAVNDQNVIGRFRADLRALAGKSACIFTSGILGNSPAFGLYAALADGTVMRLEATPTAQIQLVHNSPDPTLDLYAGDHKVADDWTFRSATPYFEVPADRAVTFQIAGSTSISVADAFLPQDLSFESGKTYTVYAAGVIFGNPAYTLISHISQKTGTQTTKVDYYIHHGSPDAPALEVEIFEGSTLAGNLSYGQFSTAGSLDTGVYYLQVKQSGFNVLLGTWLADLRQWGGQAIEIFVSGYAGSNPALGLFAVLADGTVVTFPPTPSPPVFARLQLIQNSAFGAVDVYANDIKIAEDLDFRRATTFLEIRKGAYNLAFAPAASTKAGDAFFTLPQTFTGGKTYVMMSIGLPGNTDTPFSLIVNEQAKETAPFPFGVDVSFWHGAAVPASIDIDALYESNNLVQGLAYGQFSPYLSLGPQAYDFVLRSHDSTQAITRRRANLAGIIGQAAHLFTSGILQGTPAFGLFAAYNDGSVVELPLTPTTKVQIVHNAVDPTIDLYAGNTLLADDLEYRHATTYLDLPADRPLRFGVAGAGSNNAFDVLFPFVRSLKAGKSHVLFANGIVFDTIFPLDFLTDTALVTSGDPAKVSFAFLHGAPRLDSIDVSIFGSGSLFTNVSFGEFTTYTALNPGTYYLQFRKNGQSDLLKTFEVGLDSLAGQAFRLFLSGPAPELRLFGAFADGRVIEFPTGSAVPLARAQFIHNSPSATVDIYFDNQLQFDNFEFRKATPFAEVIAGREIEIGIAPENSTSAFQAFSRFKVRFIENKTYVITLSGLSGVNLIVHENGRETAPAPNMVSIALLHGVPNAPTVDVDAVFVSDNLISNLAFGQHTDYLELPPALYDFAIRPSGSNTPVATYRADLSALGGQAAYVFAGGLLSGTPNFGLFAALPNGQVLTLPATPMARVQWLHNAPEAPLDLYAGNSRFINDFQFKTATRFLNIPAERPIVFGVASDNSNGPGAALVNFTIHFETGKTYLVSAIGILGGNPALDLAINANARDTAPNGAVVALNFLHGGINAPAVDADALLVANDLVKGLGYAQYSPYVELLPEIQDFALRAAGNPQSLGAFRADLNNRGGQAACIFAGGIAGGTPALALYALWPDGVVTPLTPTPVSRVQFIHNAPEATLDLYAGRVRLSDNLGYRGATAFLTLPANRDFALGFGGETSQSANDAFARFNRNWEAGKIYTVMIGGKDLNLQLFTTADTRETAQNTGNFEVRYFNGASDADPINIVAYSGNVSFSNAAYGAFMPYLSVSTAEHLISVQSGATVLETAVVKGNAGQSGTMFSTGFAAGAPDFRTWMALADGTTYPLPTFVGTATPQLAPISMQLSPNPAHTFLQLRFESGTPERLQYYVRDVSGRVLKNGQLDAAAGSAYLSLEGLTPGSYLLDLRAVHRAGIARFIIGRE